MEFLHIGSAEKELNHDLSAIYVSDGPSRLSIVCKECNKLWTVDLDEEDLNFEVADGSNARISAKNGEISKQFIQYLRKR